ncbi:MAG: HIT family protein [Gammaproteobacteria bacterium]|nr:HIT family protein [Gammaproteobacteria bacterium]
MSFVLDARLEKDGICIAENAGFVLNLMNDARYPWLVLIPKVPNITELFELNDAQHRALNRATQLLGYHLMNRVNADKLNVAAIGNIVSQLHVHIVARHRADFSWPAPVWGVGESQPYTEPELHQILTKLGSLQGLLDEASNA